MCEPRFPTFHVAESSWELGLHTHECFPMWVESIMIPHPIQGVREFVVVEMSLRQKSSDKSGSS